MIQDLKPGDIIYYVPDCLYGPVNTYKILRFSYNCIVMTDGFTEKSFIPPLTCYYKNLNDAEEDRLRQITNKVLYNEYKIEKLKLDIDMLHKSMNLKGTVEV